MIYDTIMEWFIMANQLPKSIFDLKRKIIDATIDIFHRISKELRPTPAKSHYTYNLRDLSKVFQGIS